jgi:WD40 repeat protein
MDFVLIAVLLNACTFSVEVLPTVTAFAPTVAALPPTFTPVPVMTFAAASETPTAISIRSDTPYLLEVINTFELGDSVHGLAFTPDSTVLAAAGGNNDDFSIRLWDVINGQPLGTLGEHNGIVWSVAFSPDGQLLASVSSDATAKIWDWRSKTLIKSLDFPAEVSSVSFSPDGQILAIGGVDEPENQIRNAAIWTFAVGSWQPLLKFREYLNVTAMAYSPQGGTLIGGGTSRNVQVWRANDGTSVFTLSHAHQVAKVVISPDGSTVATATCITVVNSECTDGGVWLWDLPTGKLSKKLAGFPSVVENVGFSADGSALIAASRDGTLRFYSTVDYVQISELISPGGISALTLSPDGAFLATGNHDGGIQLWKNVYHP